MANSKVNRPDVGTAPTRPADFAGLVRELREKPQRLQLALDPKSVDIEARTVELAFCSEEPYERWWGVEILDCARASVRMDRLNNGAAVLVNHDAGQHVGVVERARIDADRKGRAQVRFGRAVDADDVLQDIADGIRTKVSVGYRIHDLVLEKQENDQSTYRVTDWEPYEISIVSVPADDTVGIGRSAQRSSKREKIMATENEGRPRGLRRALSREALKLQEALIPQADRRGFNEFLRDEEYMRELGVDPQDNQGAYETYRAEAIRTYADMWSNTSFGSELKVRATIALGDPTVTADAFHREVLQMIERNQAEPTRTGTLEADRLQPDHQQPGSSDLLYGQGGREVFNHRPLRCFKGADGQRVAHAFGMFLLAQMPGNARAQRWVQDKYGQRALSSGGAGTGGELVPQEVSSMLIKNLDSYGVARREAQLWPMGSDSLRVPTNTSRPTASFNAPGTEVAASDPGFGGVLLSAKMLMAQTVVARETMEDAVIALGDFVGQSILEAFAEKEDACLFVGDGTSTYGGMVGIKTALLAGSKVAAASAHDTTAEIDATDLANVMAALPQYAQPGAKWYMSMAFYGAILQRLLLAAGGNNVRTLETGTSKTPSFAGFDVILTPSLPSDTTGTYNVLPMLFFGDMRRTAAFGDRQVISLLVDPYTLAGKGQIRIVGYERFDTVVHGIGTATAAGPMIVLNGKT